MRARSRRGRPRFLVPLLSTLLALGLFHSLSAATARLLDAGEGSVRVAVDLSDLRVEPRETPEGLRGLPVSLGAVLHQEGGRTWLSLPVQLAVPPGMRPVLRVLREEAGPVDWPAPPALSLDSLAESGGPRRAGVRQLDCGWQRSQKVQRLAVDLAVHDAAAGGWSRLRELEFELVFQEDARERERLAASRPGGARNRAFRESPVFEALQEIQLLNAAQARAWRVDPARLAGPAVQALSDAGNPALEDEWIVRLMVDQDGVVVVSGRDLRNAGVELEDIDAATLSLWEGGRELPLLLQDGGDGRLDLDDRFWFAGRHREGPNFPTDFFSPENAYFLTWGHGTGRRFVEWEGLPRPELPDQESFRHRQHYEKNLLWNSLKGVSGPPDVADHWLWRELRAAGGPASFQEVLVVPDTGPREGDELDRIRFAMRGESESNAPGADHHVIVRMDGQWVGDLEGVRRQETVSDWFPIPPGALEGRERVTLDFVLPLDRGLDQDVAYLNWVQLEYRRSLVLPEDGQLIVPVEELTEANLVLAGLLTEAPLLLSEDGWVLRGARPVDGRRGVMRFRATGVEGDLFLAERAMARPPARIVRHANARLRDMDQQADMLVVAPAMYMSALQDLVDYHEERGLTVRVVDMEAIYSEFRDGEMHSQALQDFLSHTFHHWESPAPSYLTLVGRASRANQIKLGQAPRYRTQVPTWWVQTATSGATATDENYTYLVGADSLWSGAQLVEVVPDTFQDLLVGRISVNSTQQLVDYLDKHREYREGSVQGRWQETQVMAADMGNDQIFEIGNEYVSRAIVPRSYPVASIHVDERSPYHGGALDFIDLFNEGCTVLNYNGHGAIGILSSRSLFRATDIRFLSNRGMYPINFAWSCLVGYFDDPDSASMAELLLRKPRAGSIAFYGSTAKATINVDNPLMMNYFFHQYSEQHLTLGQIVQLTENNLLLTGNTADIIHMYNLQGDPALVPAFPRLKLVPEPAVLALGGGQTASFTLRTEPPGLSGTLEGTFLPFAHEPVNFQGSNLRRYSLAFTDGQTVGFDLPPITESREARLLLALNTSQGRATGFLSVFLNSPFAGSGDHSPERGLAGAPLQFRFESPMDVDSVVVQTNLVQNAALPMTNLGGGVFAAQLDQLPAASSNAYSPLSVDWLQEWSVDIRIYPYFQSDGLLYRFRVFDAEEYTDSDGDGRFDPGEPYVDADGDGQWDPAGEPFEDSNGNGTWNAGESFTDVNGNGLRDAWVDLAGRYVGILENERIRAVDSLLTVAGDAGGLVARLRWTASVNQTLEEVDERLERHDGAGWNLLWSGRQPAVVGPQLLEAPLDLAPGAHRLRAKVGPLFHQDQPLPHVDSLALVDEFTLLTPAQGSGGVLGVPGASGWELSVPGALLQAPVQLDPGLLGSADPPLRETDQGQPGLGLLAGGSAGALRALELAPRVTERAAEDLRPVGATLGCRVGQGSLFRFPDGMKGDSLPLALARWIPERGLWVVQPGTATALADAGGWSLEARLALEAGWWWPVALDDDQGPALTLQAANQWFGAGDVVPAEPVFQFLLQDPNGLDLGEGAGAPRLLLDGVPVAADRIQTGEGTTSVQLQWSPGLLEAGSQHSFRLEARDALGNLTTLDVPFRVSGGLGLEFFANHPNPFQESTTFAWQLSNVPRSLRFEIYTASGRLVRRMEIPTPRIGYDETTWDGRDHKGRDVANGVYFLRVVADGDASVDEVYKLARLR
jgi:hypothetical protein